MNSSFSQGFDIRNLPIETMVNHFIEGRYRYESPHLIPVVVNYIKDKNYRFTKEELIALRKVVSDQRETLAHQLAYIGHKFTFDELQIMGIVPSDFMVTVPYYMAKNGHFLEFDELVSIGNPAIVNGWTVAHEMAKQGYVFSIEELICLGNPCYTGGKPYNSHPVGWTVAHEMARCGFYFSVQDLLTLGNPPTCDLDPLVDFAKGWTIAHEMIRNGFAFTIDEINQLGNPEEGGGYSISDMLAMQGKSFSTKEWKRLEKSAHIFPAGFTSAHLTYKDHNPVFFSGYDGRRISLVGKTLTLEFGLYQVYDVQLYESHSMYDFKYKVNLVEIEEGWSAQYSLVSNSANESGQEYPPNKVQIENFISSLNRAIQKKRPLNFRDYIKFLAQD